MGCEPGDFVTETLRWDNSLVRERIRSVNLLHGDCTHDFIDDSLVGVEVEGETWVAIQKNVSPEDDSSRKVTNYFSIKTREALLVVLVRTRPWNAIVQTWPTLKHLNGAYHGERCWRLI